MPVQRMLWVLFALWAAIYGWSLWVYFFTPVTGDGFTRGLNRVTGAMAWQAMAAVFGAVIWLMGRGLDSGSPARWVTRIPAFLALMPVVAIVAVIAYAQIADPAATQRPVSSAPAKPVTAPVD